MGLAKSIVVKPLSSDVANEFVKKVHYSGRVVRNSQLHFGVYLNRALEGVMQFGPSLDKRKVQGLVVGTPWNGFTELNRLAFTDRLPRNSESRALGFAFRLMRKTYPWIKWVISFADACQCGDGTIYRAAGFVLTGVRKNTSIWSFEGKTFSDLAVRTGAKRAREVFSKTTETKGGHIGNDGAASMKRFREAGAAPLPGFQVRYIYFLDPSWRGKLKSPALPFSTLDMMRARMYRGRSIEKPAENKPIAGEASQVCAAGTTSGEGGASPTPPLSAGFPSGGY